MPSLTTGAVQAVKVPEAFSDHEEQYGGYGADNWSQSYKLPGQRFPEIVFRYSGFPLFQTEVDLFRGLLEREPGVIFDIEDSRNSGEPAVNLVRQVSAVLGNCGDNQIFNSNSGVDGAMFRLEKMEIIEIRKRPLLRVKGWFHTPGTVEPRVYLDCVFIDACPGSGECRVEELYLQAFPQDLFQKHSSDFDELLSSIQWNAS